MEPIKRIHGFDHCQMRVTAAVLRYLKVFFLIHSTFLLTVRVYRFSLVYNVHMSKEFCYSEQMLSVDRSI